MFRCGNVLPKKYVGMVWDGSKAARFDTVLQSLLGRMCGFESDFGSRKPYVFVSPNCFKKEGRTGMSQIDRYLKLFEGGAQFIMPTSGDNLVAPHDTHEERDHTLTLLLRIPMCAEHATILAKRASVMDRNNLRDIYRHSIIGELEGGAAAHLTLRDREQIYETLNDPDLRPALRDWKDATAGKKSGHFEEAVACCSRGEVTREQFGPNDFLTLARVVSSEKYPEEVGHVYVGIQLKSPDFIPRYYCEPGTTGDEMWDLDPYKPKTPRPQPLPRPDPPVPAEHQMVKDDLCGVMDVGFDEHIYADKDAFVGQLETLIDISHNFHTGKYKGSRPQSITGIMDLKKEVFGEDSIDIYRLVRSIEKKYDARITIKGSVLTHVHRITEITWVFR
jgi:hypothetical protein